jgi:predicted KAP-like P-loop ATPase
VGLTGGWGSGKSSVMGRLSDRLSSMANVIVIKYNPWVVAAGEENIQSFLRVLENTISASSFDDRRYLVNAFHNYRSSLESVDREASPTAHKILGLLPRRAERSLAGTRHELENQLSILESAVVVLIDELDRVDDTDVREMARTVKAIGDLPNISYLIAYDRPRVEQALGAHGPDYIKKLVQFTVSLAPSYGLRSSVVCEGTAR